MKVTVEHSAQMAAMKARSPDLNPIENLFNTAKRKLRRQALDEKIERETFEEFSQRVKEMLLNFPANDIDKIIDSMENALTQ